MKLLSSDKVLISSNDGTILGKNLISLLGINANYITVDIINDVIGEGSKLIIDPSTNLKTTVFLLDKFVDEEGNPLPVPPPPFSGEEGEKGDSTLTQPSYIDRVYIYEFSLIEVTEWSEGSTYHETTVILDVTGSGNFTSFASSSSGIIFNSVLRKTPDLQDIPDNAYFYQHLNSQYLLIDPSISELSFFFYPPNDTTSRSFTVTGTQLLVPTSGDPSVRADVKLLTLDVARPALGELEAGKTFFKDIPISIPQYGVCKISVSNDNLSKDDLFYTLIYR